MEKIFILHVTTDFSTLAFAFADKDKAYHVLKVIRDKFLEDKKEGIANNDYLIKIDKPCRFYTTDCSEETFFDFEVSEANFYDDTTDEDIFNKVADRIGYWMNGEYHI